MHKYNTLYIRTLSWHVLTPTSYYQTIVFKSKQSCRQTRRLRSSFSYLYKIYVNDIRNPLRYLLI